MTEEEAEVMVEEGRGGIAAEEMTCTGAISVTVGAGVIGGGVLGGGVSEAGRCAGESSTAETRQSDITE